MKKKGIALMFVVLFLLVGCNKGQSENLEIVESVTPTVEVTQAVEPLSVENVQQEPSQEELEQIFRSAYKWGCMFRDGDIGMTEEEILQCELDDISGSFVLRVNLKKPVDLEDQYMAWRSEQLPVESIPVASIAPETQVNLFNDCNMVMYATGTVNIRTSYSLDSDKLGTMHLGEYITCTGIGTGKATGWNRVQLVDGSTAYMVSSYLSTSKPVSQVSNGGGTQTAVPPSSGDPMNGNSIFYNPFEGMTEEERAAQAEKNKAEVQEIVDGITSILH